MILFLTSINQKDTTWLWIKTQLKRCDDEEEYIIRAHFSFSIDFQVETIFLLSSRCYICSSFPLPFIKAIATFTSNFLESMLFKEHILVVAMDGHFIIL